MMSQTMRTIFNMPIKISLLILICVLLWQAGHCQRRHPERHQQHQDAVTKATSMATAVSPAPLSLPEATQQQPHESNHAGSNDGDDGDDRAGSAVQSYNPHGLLWPIADGSAEREGTRGNNVRRSRRSAALSSTNIDQREDCAVDEHRRWRGKAAPGGMSVMRMQTNAAAIMAVIATGHNESNAIKIDASRPAASTEVSRPKAKQETAMVAVARLTESYADALPVTLPAIDVAGDEPAMIATGGAAAAAAVVEAQQRLTASLAAATQAKLIYDFAIKYKQIPRITFFTCHDNKNNNNDNADNAAATTASRRRQTIEILKRLQGSGETSATATTITETTTTSTTAQSSLATGVSGNAEGAMPHDEPQTTPERKQLNGALLIKVVPIDQLINKRSNARSGVAARQAGNERNSQMRVPPPPPRPSGYGNRYGPAGDGFSGAGLGAFSHANWLERALHNGGGAGAGPGRRQVVVLDLSCAPASRRLLEMASNRALLNGNYHWLLINSNNSNNNAESDLKTTTMTTTTTPSLTGKRLRRQTANRQMSDVNFAPIVVSRRGGAAPLSPATSNNRQRVNNASAATLAGHAGELNEDMAIIEHLLATLNININTELTLAKGTSASVSSGSGDGDGGYALYDVWNAGREYGGQLNISEIGNFTLDDGLQIVPRHWQTATIRRRMDMQLARIRCLVVVTNRNRTDSLEHYLTTHYDTHLDSMNRFNFALLSHVRDLYNFSFVLSQTPTWGYLKNGRFDGMIGALVRRQADIGGSPIFFRIERAKVIDYTVRTWVARPCFIFRHPRSTKKDRIVFLQPFTNDAWLLVAFCGIITTLLLWVLTTLEALLEARMAQKTGQAAVRRGGRIGAKGGRPMRQQNAAAAPSIDMTPSRDGSPMLNASQQRESNRMRVAQRSPPAVASETRGFKFKLWLVRLGQFFCGRDGLLFESVLFYVGSICQQGLSFSTKFFSGRCIIITSLLFSFAIYQFYSASIVGTLLMEKPKSIRTVRDLIHTSLDIGIEDIVYNRDYFLRTKDPDAIELYAKKVSTMPSNTEQGFLELPPDAAAVPTLSPEAAAAAKAKSYREILHSHEAGAHAKTNEASNWYAPAYGVAKIKKGHFAFHVDVATAYKMIADTFSEKEICELAEIQLFPPQKMVNIVPKGSPLREVLTYGLRRVTEAGLMDYQRKVWHSPKPRCVKQIHTDDLRVDLQTFSSALLVLLFGYGMSLMALALEIMHHGLSRRTAMAASVQQRRRSVTATS